MMFFPMTYLRGFLLGAVLLLTGCAGTSTLYSNTFIKPTTRITKINVVYIESQLTSKRGGAAMSFYDIGYSDLPELFRERVPIVLSLNNIKTEYATFKSGNFGQAEAMETIKWSGSGPDSMLLTLQVMDGQVVTGSHTPRTTTLNLHANLIDPKTRLRQWTGQFRNHFVAPPVGKNGFDNAFVDNFLKIVLEQMAKDGMIHLPDNQAVIPKPQKPTPQSGGVDAPVNPAI